MRVNPNPIKKEKEIKFVKMDFRLLKEFEDNPRINDNVIEPLINSMKSFGEINPIIINKDNTIIAGHSRFKAIRKMFENKEKEDCIINVGIVDLNPEEMRVYNIVDNKLGELAEWDNESLEKGLAEINNFDLSKFGFDDIFKKNLLELNEDEIIDKEENQGKLDNIKLQKCPKCGTEF